jgi:hypothetical protein
VSGHGLAGMREWVELDRAYEAGVVVPGLSD